MEKTPTAEVQQFVSPVEVDLNILSPEEEQILQKTMHRLAERVRKEEGGRRGEGGRGGWEEGRREDEQDVTSYDKIGILSICGLF